MIPPLHSTAEDVAGSRWDLVVIGAGPAGALTAQQTARAGLRVLLVDAKTFPRDKVCGGCLNDRALSVLAAAGLDSLRRALPGTPLERIEFRNQRQRLVVSAPGGVSLSRSVFDAALVVAAVESGAVFVPGTSATLLAELDSGRPLTERRVRLEAGGRRWLIAADCVAISDGLNRRSLRETADEFPADVASRSWIGLGATLASETVDLVPGLLRMAIGTSGYVGSVRVEQERLNMAAAISAECVRRSGTPGRAIVELLKSAGVDAPDEIADAKWSGTGPLSRRSLRVAGNRVLLVGDATGYVEPITGEGMTWALSSALEAAPLLIRGAESWSLALADGWETRHRQTIRQRQFWCRGLTAALRRPWLVRSCLTVARCFPAVPRFIAAQINQPVAGRAA
jgi:menaquinone-9 beta-reductase